MKVVIEFLIIFAMLQRVSFLLKLNFLNFKAPDFKPPNLERLRLILQIIIRFFNRRQGFILRCLLCWAIACFVVSTDELKSYDKRFRTRPDQKVSDEIVLVMIQKSDMSRLYLDRLNLLANISDVSEVSDTYYWNKNLWAHLLAKIIQQRPQIVGITLFFGEGIDFETPTLEDFQTFHDPRVIWATPGNKLDRFFAPIYTNPNGSNLGNYDLLRDDDGIVRHIFPHTESGLHFLEKVTHRNFPDLETPAIINFRGSTRVFKQYFLSDILAGNIPRAAFKDKIVLIGAETSPGLSFLTPIGRLTRAEIFAHVADNMIENRWIQRLNFAWYAAGLFLLMTLSVFIIIRYPQSIAFYFFIWEGTALAALSAWVFDFFYLWVPAFSPFILLMTTWIVFIGYQASKMEKLHFRLKQDQKYMRELEQIKNNFVSLISHDLKTPIAKIQAIVDRVIAQNPDTQFMQDLLALRTSGEELNRYIRSILKVLRVEARDFRLHKEATDINSLIEEVQEQLRPLAEAKNLKYQTQLEPLFSMEIDVNLIKEVILNLIENAIKYSQAGGTVSVESREIDGSVIVEIVDQGEGIPPDELVTVWNKFTRGKDQDLKTKGTGLGLYLVKYFIELHGGKVTMESQLGVGTKVGFSLPVAAISP